ncbi:FUSC family protein [Georgenia faecalis]|uniref:FUSC family protein n=1 Tax=Georgenia faecalis TaxID=2483799 RepID=UPI000FDAEC51|nr:FUSC family protein [Georgenia faecalis]
MSWAALGERTDLRRWLVLLRLRARQGVRRVSGAVTPVVTAALAAAVAWALAYYVLGHQYPFFAPVSAWVCLGFSADRQVRRVGELAIGVSLGVALGELIAHFIGTGVVQIFLVVVIAGLTARFVDRGQLLTVQAGVQGIVIVALPVAVTGGPAGRWVDALVGGACALVVALATPRDARRRTRMLARSCLTELSVMLRTLAEGIGAGDAELVRDALVQGRGTQGILDQWESSVHNARQAARLSPAARRFLPELARLERASVVVDRAMRNARVAARRALSAVEEGGRDADIAEAVHGLSRGAALLGAALSSGGPADAARAELARVGPLLAPERFQQEGWRMQGVVILLRPLAVDLLQGTGLPYPDAAGTLGGDADDGDTGDGDTDDGDTGDGAAGDPACSADDPDGPGR